VSGISSIPHGNNKSCRIYISHTLRTDTFRSSSCRFDSCSHLRAVVLFGSVGACTVTVLRCGCVCFVCAVDLVYAARTDMNRAGLASEVIAG